MCGRFGICENPTDSLMTCSDCKGGLQARNTATRFQKKLFIFQFLIDQLLETETLDTIVDYLANGEFCANNGDERCPAAVDGVIRQGLPMLAAAAAQADFSEVSF